MKKLLSLTLALAALVTSAAGCAPGKKSYQAHTYTKKEINAYPLKDKTALTFECLFREDLPEIPFADAEDFLDQLFTEKVGFEKGENGKFNFTNGGYTLTVDAENDTVSCDCIEGFILTNHKIYSEDEEAGYIINNGFATVDEIKPFFVDLGKYEIDAAESGGRVYLPFCTLGDLFADTGCALLYKNGELFFRSGADTLSASGGQGKLEETRSKAMADFSYNELCLTMDSVYGLPSMSALSESVGEKGFDETLLSYSGATKKLRGLLRSEDNREYCAGIRLLNCFLYDGGHTQMDYGYQRVMGQFGIPNAVGVAEYMLGGEESELGEMQEAIGELAEMNERKSLLVAEKKAAYEQLELVSAENGASLYRSGDTYFFDFNVFENKIVKPFKDALDYAAAHDAKNFVIDLSTNGGGSDGVVNYMLSVVLGEDTHLFKSTLSDSVFRTNILVDKNLDGEFDAKDDAVAYDFRFAVITSRYSYSNANCMPCAAQDGGVAILGERSGGGSCIVTAHYYPDGCMYCVSGASKNIHPNGADVDGGTVPDTALPGAAESYSGFYDTDAINTGIDAFYSK